MQKKYARQARNNKEQERSFFVQNSEKKYRLARGLVRTEPLDFRGRFLTAIAIRIDVEQPNASFIEALDEGIRTASNLLMGAPIVLDFEPVSRFVDRDLLREVIGAIRSRGLLLFGVQNANEEQQAVAQEFGLIPIHTGRDAPVRKGRADAPTRSRFGARTENKIITKNVRSGQMIVAERGDLTVIGSVASGAELVASGNIHVYGALRGRAMAGANGDASARIFCRRLEAELLAITGLFKTSETIDSDLRRCSVQIFLEDEILRIERFE